MSIEVVNFALGILMAVGTFYLLGFRVVNKREVHELIKQQIAVAENTVTAATNLRTAVTSSETALQRVIESADVAHSRLCAATQRMRPVCMPVNIGTLKKSRAPSPGRSLETDPAQADFILIKHKKA